MKRGDIFAGVLPGRLGKPRPLLIVQGALLDEGAFVTVTVLPLTSTLLAAPLYRITVQPSQENGLPKVSQIQVDKASTILRTKVGPVIGRLEAPLMVAVDRYLALWLGLVI